MKFDLFTHIPWPEGREPGQVLAELTREVQWAEELGFHRAWLAEHHFTRYGLGSSLVVLVSNIAAKTSKIRLGTAVLLVPLHSPVRLAEDTATLDILSGGRLDVGFGRGTDNWDYQVFKVDWQESQQRFREAIELLKGLWTTPDYSFQGEHFRVQHLNLVPPPLQRPHPPVYLAATRSQASLEYVASSGHPLMIGQPLDTANALDHCHNFLKLAQEAGHRMTMDRIPFIRFCYVAETEEQAQREAAVGLNWIQDMVQWRHTFKEGTEVYHHLDQWRQHRTAPPPDLEHLYNQRAFIGSPGQIADKINLLKEQGIDCFGGYFDFGGMDHGKVLRSMELFAREVMPQLS